MLLPCELIERAWSHPRRQWLRRIKVLGFVTIKESGQVIISCGRTTAQHLVVPRTDPQSSDGLNPTELASVDSGLCTRLQFARNHDVVQKPGNHRDKLGGIAGLKTNDGPESIGAY